MSREGKKSLAKSNFLCLYLELLNSNKLVTFLIWKKTPRPLRIVLNTHFLFWSAVSCLKQLKGLKGKMTTSAPFANSVIRLAHSGSKSAQANIDWQNYPFYNEALGVVSFLKQPKAKHALASS